MAFSRRDSREHPVAGQPPDWSRRAQQFDWATHSDREAENIVREMELHSRLCCEDLKARWFAIGVFFTSAIFGLGWAAIHFFGAMP